MVKTVDGSESSPEFYAVAAFGEVVANGTVREIEATWELIDEAFSKGEIDFGTYELYLLKAYGESRIAEAS